MNEWVESLQSVVYSRIKTIATQKLKTKYPNIKFTTIPIDTTKATFPTVYVHEVTVNESNRKLERRIVDGVNYIVQVEVFANDSTKTAAREISYVINDIMKRMLFDGKEFPIPEYNTNYTRCVARYEKIICSNDVL